MIITCKGTHILIPGTCEFTIYMAKEDSAAMIILMIQKRRGLIKRILQTTEFMLVVVRGKQKEGRER